MVVPERGHKEGEITLAQLSDNVTNSLPPWGDTSQLNVTLLDVVYEVEDLPNATTPQQYRRRHAARKLIPKFADEQESEDRRHQEAADSKRRRVTKFAIEQGYRPMVPLNVIEEAHERWAEPDPEVVLESGTTVELVFQVTDPTLPLPLTAHLSPFTLTLTLTLTLTPTLTLTLTLPR